LLTRSDGEQVEVSESITAARFPPLPLGKGSAVHSSIASDNRPALIELSDESLLAQIMVGDREALALLFRRYAGLAHGIGRRILRDNAEAEDLVQDVFLHIARKCYLFDGSKGSARSWIVQVTYFQALNRKGYLTEQHYYNALNVENSEVEQLPTPVIAEYDHSGEALFGRKRWQRIREILTEDQWETIRLHFFEGCTFAEIGERRNQPQGNVRNHFYRGLARLRKYVFRRELQGC
jgi:RNA polymerase sigma-70 factor (ECF subfamily)